MSLSYTRLLLFYHCLVCIDGKWKQFNDCVWLCRYEYWLLITLRLACHVIELDAIKMTKMKRMKDRKKNKKIEQHFFLTKQSMKSQRKCYALFTGVTKIETIRNIKWSSNMETFRNRPVYFFYRFCYRTRSLVTENYFENEYPVVGNERLSVKREWERAREESRRNLLRLSPFCFETLFLSHISISLYSDNCSFWYFDVFYTITAQEVHLYTYNAI